MVEQYDKRCRVLISNLLAILITNQDARSIFFLNFNEMDELAESYRGWVEEALKKVRHRRERKWTESIAVGSESFVTETKERLGFKARGRVASERDGVYELREPVVPYSSNSGHENAVVRSQNGYLGKVFEAISVWWRGPTRLAN